MRKFLFRSTLLVFSASSLIAEEKTMIVLDASGSMWGQIETIPKISIATNTIADLLPTLDPNSAVGLMAYGHRQKGDCRDIETLIAPAKGAAADIIQTLSTISPKGKTPMSDAVRLAAESMRYEEDKSTVILISDGVETCAPDPCATARVLEDTGVDFTAHVIGFDIKDPEADAQLACLAEETGGVYLSAENAADLSLALNQVVQEVKSTPTITLNGPDEADIAAFVPIGWRGLDDLDMSAGGFEVIVRTPQGPKINGQVIRGSSPTTLEMPAFPGRFEIALIEIAGQKDLAVGSIIVRDVAVSLHAAENAEAGSQIEISWTGPGYPTDRITIGTPNTWPLSQSMLGAEAQSPMVVTLPETPGDYVISYMLSQDQTILASRPITVSPAGPDAAFLACFAAQAAAHPDPVVQILAQTDPLSDVAEITEFQSYTVARFLMSLTDLCGTP